MTCCSPGSLSLLPALETLNLDENKLSGRLDFLQQPSLKSLADINLDANRFTEIVPEDFVFINNLRSLLVNRNQLQDINFLSHPKFAQVWHSFHTRRDITEQLFILFLTSIFFNSNSYKGNFLWKWWDWLNHD